MPRDLFEENGIQAEPRDLFEEHGINPHGDSIDKSSLEPSFMQKLAPNILAGLAQGGHEIINAPHNIAQLISPKLGARIPKQQDYDYAQLLGLPDTASLSDKLVRGLAQNLPGIVAPEAKLGKLGEAIEKVPYAGRLLRKSIGNALPASIYSAIQNPESPGSSAAEAGEATLPFSAVSNFITSANPYARIVGRLGLGAVGGALGYEGAKQLGINPELGAVAGGTTGLIGASPSKLAKETMLEGVEKTPYQEKLAAANRLGLKYLTPAEASGNPFVAAQQGAAGKTKEGSQLLYNQGIERLNSERKSINNLFNDIYNKKELDPKVKELYRQAYQKEVPQEFVDNLKNNEVFNTAVDRVLNKPAYQESLKDVPENSIAYLDHVKQAIDDMIERAPKKEARLLKQTRTKLVDQMDEISPEYKQARSFAERGILRSKLENSLNDKDIRGTNFYNKILKNDKTFNKTRYALRNAPEAQKQLDDMRTIFGDLINPPTVRTAAGLANTGMRQNRNSLTDFATTIKNKLTGDRYDKAAVELITNPKWADELHRVTQIGNKRKAAAKFIDLLGRATALSTSNKEPMNLELNNFAGQK